MLFISHKCSSYRLGINFTIKLIIIFTIYKFLKKSIKYWFIWKHMYITITIDTYNIVCLDDMGMGRVAKARGVSTAWRHTARCDDTTPNQDRNNSIEVYSDHKNIVTRRCTVSSVNPKILSAVTANWEVSFINNSEAS